MKDRGNVSPWRWLLVFLVLGSLHGCAGQGGGSDQIGTGFVTGQILAGSGVALLLQGGSSSIRLAVDADGKFAGAVPPGMYKILLEAADGTLKLTEQKVTVEDNLSVSLLNISLVPQPSVVSVSVPLVYHDSAVVEWETDIESDGRVDYGFDTLYGYSSFTDTDLTRQHRIQINGLSPSTSYHFRIVASRHSLESVQTFSRDYIFTTEPVPMVRVAP